MAKRVEWGGGPLKYLEAETLKWLDHAEKLLEYWVDLVAWKRTEHVVGDLIEKTTAVQKHKDDVEIKYKAEYVIAVLAPFASLKGPQK